MDTPRQKTIKIGTSTVGLVGLEAALNSISNGNFSDEEIKDRLFDAVQKSNYVPAGTEDLYKEALLREYKQFRQKEPGKDDHLVIRILGRPCVSCNQMKAMVIDILQEMEVAADIEDIQELDEIWRYGVTKTPALLINNTVKSAGILPRRAQIEAWLREAADKYGKD